MGLFSLFSNDDAETAAAQRNAGLTQGYSDLSTQYDNARTAINTGANTAAGYYAPLIASTGAGATAYGNASGANGTAGLQTAMNDFHNSGQYGNFGFTLTNGLQALDRTHAAAGNLNSGNADADTLNYATGLANNTYNSYVAGLQPYLGANSSAVSGAAGVATGQGTALANTDVAQGNAVNATDTGIGASNAAATMNNYAVGNNIMGAIGMGVGALTGTGGLTGGLSSVFGNPTGGTPGAAVQGTFGPSSYGGPNGPTPTTGGSLFGQFLNG
jgi:hypothetical protein